MIINVKVIPGAKKNEVVSDGEGLKVRLSARPVDGKANAALVALLAEHFGVKKRQIEIIKGLQSRRKTINIMDI